VFYNMDLFLNRNAVPYKAVSFGYHDTVSAKQNMARCGEEQVLTGYSYMLIPLNSTLGLL